jgi:hypothetical protein
MKVGGQLRAPATKHDIRLFLPLLYLTLHRYHRRLRHDYDADHHHHHKQHHRHYNHRLFFFFITVASIFSLSTSIFVAELLFFSIPGSPPSAFPFFFSSSRLFSFSSTVRLLLSISSLPAFIPVPLYSFNLPCISFLLFYLISPLLSTPPY